MKISIIKDITTAVRGDRSYKSRTAGLPTRYVEQPLLSGKVTIEVEADGKTTNRSRERYYKVSN
jgi:hypothetical protein